jgi:hypothetical protein
MKPVKQLRMVFIAGDEPGITTGGKLYIIMTKRRDRWPDGRITYSYQITHDDGTVGWAASHLFMSPKRRKVA